MSRKKCITEWTVEFGGKEKITFPDFDRIFIDPYIGTECRFYTSSGISYEKEPIESLLDKIKQMAKEEGKTICFSDEIYEDVIYIGKKKRGVPNE